MKASDPSILPESRSSPGQIPQRSIQHPRPAPLLEPPVHGLVIRMALRHHVPLGTGLQDPQNGLENTPGRHRRPPAPLSPSLLGKVVADPLPLVVGQLSHKKIYSAATVSERSWGILR